VAGYSREEAKVAAALRAQRALEKAFDQIDWLHDVYRPTLAQVRAGELKLVEGDGTKLLEITRGDDA
jgi:hypothetical protein